MSNVKTIARFLTPETATVGDPVRIVAGAFAGMHGTVTDRDGDWRTVQVTRADAIPGDRDILAKAEGR